ncbi:docking protein 1b [Polypterus senegalus]|uniref:docking protein 1b n=1 Tax=Polypterus senegalus TaxID=55291 RepID=UPI0019654974|nr:docking protein 1b [Polypterus senegalus]
MDKPVKEGLLFAQYQKFGKKWKKSWFVLYAASLHGIARIEFFDCSNPIEKPSTKKLDKKIIRLAECISIVPLHTETCPKENMLAFSVETDEKIYIFASEQESSKEWINKLCECTFTKPVGDMMNETKRVGGKTPKLSDIEQVFEMADNSIYESRQEVRDFKVTVQKTEASERCSLSGSYIMRADKEGLILKDPETTKTLFIWPYKLLRRYGRDKVMFSIEAGRRCDSGPGNFNFETKQGSEIFQIVDEAIQQQKAQYDDNGQCSSLDSDSSAIQQIRNAIAESMTGAGATGRAPQIIEPEADSVRNPGSGSRPNSADGIFIKKDSSQSEDKEKMLKNRILPEPPGMSSKPVIKNKLPRSINLPAEPSTNDNSNLYSEPVDSVKPCLHLEDSFYSVPVDSINTWTKVIPTTEEEPRKPSSKGEPLYSDIYDNVSVDVESKIAALRIEVIPRNVTVNPEEHIYDEPEGRAKLPTPHESTLYDEARITGNAWIKQGLEEQTGSEITYNSSTNDYPVPSSGKQQPRPKGPKPLPAPKPQKIAIPKKELPKPLAHANLNNSNNIHIYGQVIKVKPPKKESENSMDGSLSTDSIYEDLGSI